MINYLTAIDTKKLISDLIKNDIAFVLFSLPGKKEVTIFIRNIGDVRTFNDPSEIEDKTGFLFTPFENSTVHKKYFLEPDIIINENEIKGNISNLFNDRQVVNLVSKINSDLKSTTENEFKQGVISIKNEIEKCKLKKAVLSRVKILKVTGLNEKIPLFYDLLNNKYPEAFCYLLSIPYEGLWMGASPEPLLQSDNKSFSTVALAGTKYLNGKPIEEVLWTEKELDEHYMVSKYIIEKLKNLNVRFFNMEGPRNYKAGRLAHLKTEFSFLQKLPPFTLGKILKTLHPTPSVCGYPTDEAFEIIQKTERHQRYYYTGLIGPVNYNDSNQVFVNLRCMQAFQDQVVLYAGAGITKGSDPLKEWEETGQKFETISSVLNNGEL